MAVLEHGGHLQATTDDLAETLGPRWVDGPGPLYVKLASSLRAAIDDGSLAAGTYLPSERALARALFIGRSTVVAAYRLLRSHGVLASQQGSGTWVRGRTAGTFGDERTLSILARDPYLSRVVDASPVPIDLTLPTPRAALEQIAASGMLEHIGSELIKDAAPLGYQPRGLRSFRRALLRHLESRGLPTGESELLVTNGAQQAISLLLSLFLRPNDDVVVENPSYRGLIDALLFSRARVLPLPIEDLKLPSRLQELATTHTPRLIYLTPTCHNPTGSTLDPELRREVARVATGLGVPLVEDTVLADLSLQGTVVPLAAYARPGSPVIVVGSLSKVIWGGLRIGWIRAPSAIISRLARVKAVADMGTSAVSQIVALELLANLERGILEAQREEVSQSLALAEELLSSHVPEWRWKRPDGGRSLWIRLPRGDARDFAQLALLHGVALSAGPTLAFDDSFTAHVRVQFVQPPEVLREGCWRLADAWNAYVEQL